MLASIAYTLWALYFLVFMGVLLWAGIFGGYGLNGRLPNWVNYMGYGWILYGALLLAVQFIAYVWST